MFTTDQIVQLIKQIKCKQEKRDEDKNENINK